MSIRRCCISFLKPVIEYLCPETNSTDSLDLPYSSSEEEEDVVVIGKMTVVYNKDREAAIDTKNLEKLLISSDVPLKRKDIKKIIELPGVVSIKRATEESYSEVFKIPCGKAAYALKFLYMNRREFNSLSFLCAEKITENHSNLTQVYRIALLEKVRDDVFLVAVVSDFVEGKNLVDLILTLKKNKALHETYTNQFYLAKQHFIFQIALAMNQLYLQGMSFQRISLEDIMVSCMGEVKIINYSRTCIRDETSTDSYHRHISQNSLFLGIMALELLLEKNLEHIIERKNIANSNYFKSSHFIQDITKLLVNQHEVSLKTIRLISLLLAFDPEKKTTMPQILEQERNLFDSDRLAAYQRIFQQFVHPTFFRWDSNLLIKV